MFPGLNLSRNDGIRTSVGEILYQAPGVNEQINELK